MSNKWRVIWKIENDTYDFLVAVYIKDSGGYSVVAETYAADVNSTMVSSRWITRAVSSSE